VEFKRRGIVNLSQFRAAKVVTQARNENYHIQTAMDQNRDSFYDENSGVLMKQCSSYAMTYRTQYIALFNWDSLVLVRFIRMNPSLSTDELLKKGVGDWCQTTLIPYTNGSHTMMAALLGFLAEAWQLLLSNWRRSGLTRSILAPFVLQALGITCSYYRQCSVAAVAYRGCSIAARGGLTGSITGLPV
jgi:hypothetical protein